VAGITNSASVIHPDTQFDSFLFAAIGESKEGMCITVLSALARLNIDPWKKAAELSRLPGDVARQKLASLIATLPDLRPANLEPETIDRLVTLLPARKISLAVNQTGFGSITDARTLVIYVALLAGIIGTAYIWANSQPWSPGEGFHAPVSGTVLPQPKSNR
jgi:hypothetical protein